MRLQACWLHLLPKEGEVSCWRIVTERCTKRLKHEAVERGSGAGAIDTIRIETRLGHLPHEIQRVGARERGIVSILGWWIGVMTTKPSDAVLGIVGLVSRRLGAQNGLRAVEVYRVEVVLR